MTKSKPGSCKAMALQGAIKVGNYDVMYFLNNLYVRQPSTYLYLVYAII